MPLWAFLGMARWKWVVRLESHAWSYTSMNSLALFHLCFSWCTKSLSYIKDWLKRCCSVLYCTFFVYCVSTLFVLSALLLLWLLLYMYVWKAVNVLLVYTISQQGNYSNTKTKFIHLFVKTSLVLCFWIRNILIFLFFIATVSLLLFCTRKPSSSI